MIFGKHLTKGGSAALLGECGIPDKFGDDTLVEICGHYSSSFLQILGNRQQVTLVFYILLFLGGVYIENRTPQFFNI